LAIAPLHLLPLSKQVAHYHIPDLEAWGFIPDLGICWLQNKEVCFNETGIPPLFHTHPLLAHEVCDSSGQAAHYRMISLYVAGFISEPTIGWLQNKEVFNTLLLCLLTMLHLYINQRFRQKFKYNYGCSEVCSHISLSL
jgi:hypothetical protein